MKSINNITITIMSLNVVGTVGELHAIISHSNNSKTNFWPLLKLFVTHWLKV